MFVNVFQVMLLLGFSPYRSETYQHRFYGKTPEEIKQFKLPPDESFALQSQMSVHNMLRVTFLKRLESSPYALRRSLENYQTKLAYFAEKLAQGYIIKFKDMQAIQSEFGDDLELVIDYNSGVEGDDKIALTPADTEKYNIEMLKADIQKTKEYLTSLLRFVVHLKTTMTSLKHSAVFSVKSLVSRKLARKYLFLAIMQTQSNI